MRLIKTKRLSVLIFVFLFLTELALIGCGGGGGSSTSSTPPAQTPPSPSTSPVQVSIGDAPADWIMAFGMSVNSITMTNSSGGTVSLLSSSTPTEMMQLMGTTRPLSVANVPQGTYTQATVTISSVSMGYMDPNTRQYVQKTFAGPASGTVTFSPAMTVGGGASVLNFDMDMAGSVSIDGSGSVAMTPRFTASMGAASGSGQNPWQGWTQHMVGSVSSTSASQFTMGTMMGQQTVSFATNSNTQFVAMSGMSMMSNGMIVGVDATMQPDGLLLAQRVESMWGSSGGMMGGGIVGSLTGDPPTQLTMVANNGIGGGMMMSSISGMIAVNVSSSTPYTVDSDGVDLANLPFTPAFSSSTVAKGQRIDVVSGGGMMGGGGMGGGMMGGGSSSGTINASQVRLEQQGFHGTVSNYSANGSQATFTLTLPQDSAFASLTGTSTITVYKQNGTQMHGVSTIANGNRLEVRGLLFNDSGAYKLVPSWMVQ